MLQKYIIIKLYSKISPADQFSWFDNEGYLTKRKLKIAVTLPQMHCSLAKEDKLLTLKRKYQKLVTLKKSMLLQYDQKLTKCGYVLALSGWNPETTEICV